MKTKIILHALHLLLFLSCTIKITKICGILDKNVDLIYINGQDVLISTMNIGRLAVSATREKNLLKLRVLVQNISNNRINVEPERIKIKGIKNKSHKIIDLKVWNPDKYIESLKMNQSIALSLMAIGGALRTASAGKSTTFSNSTGYIGNSVIQLNTYQTTIDNDKRNQVLKETAKELMSTKNRFDYENQILEMSLLKKHTLFTGDIIEGYVLVKNENEEYFEMSEESIIAYLIEIPFGDEIHRFKFKVIKY